MKRPGRESYANRKKHRGILRGLLLLLIGCYLVWVIFNYIASVFKAQLVEVDVAKYSHIQSVISFSGTLVRDEAVLSVPTGGKLELIVPEGERVRVGQIVARVHTPDVNAKDGVAKVGIAANRAGIVSYHLDGLEKLLVANNNSNIDLFGVVAKESPQNRKYEAGQEVKAGQETVKIVNNLEPMLLLGEIEKNVLPLDKIQPTKQVMIQMGDENNQPVFLKVVEVKMSGSKIKFTLELNNYVGEFVELRTHKFNLINDRYEGYIVPAVALVYKDKKPGIYMVYKNIARWLPVKIEGRVDEMVALSGLEPETNYVTNPQYIEEGQPIN